MHYIAAICAKRSTSRTPNMSFRLLSILYAVAVTAAQELSMDYCSVVEIETVKLKCHDIYAGGLQSNLHEICPNVECYLQCLQDAIGDCSNRNMFFREDIAVYKALYRAKCVNHELSKRAEDVCKVQTPCIDEQFHKEQVNLMHTLANISNDIETKQLECKLSAKNKACSTVKANNSCTPEMAKFQENIEIVKNSLSECKISQDHPFFKQYGGEIKCKNPKLRTQCFTASVMSRISKCQPVTLASFMNPDRSAIDNVCKNVDCATQCYSHAIGECKNKDQFVTMDPETIKVSTRAACDNSAGLASTIQQCKMTDKSCLHVLRKAMTTAHRLILEQNYKEYKNLVCSATSRFRSCIAFDVGGNCTDSMATLAKNLHEVWHSYSGCGKPNNIMFKTYARQLKCESSGPLHFSSAINLILLYLLHCVCVSSQ